MAGSLETFAKNRAKYVGGAELAEVLDLRTHQASNPVADLRVRPDLVEGFLAESIDGGDVVRGEGGPDQVVLGTEVMADRIVVALTGGLADLPTRDS